MLKYIMVVCVSLCVLVGCATQFTKGRHAFENKDYQTAYTNFLPLARTGNADAQYALGYMYYNGLGVKQDDDLASYWFVKAAAQNQLQAKKALKMIERAQTSEMFPPPPGLYDQPPVLDGATLAATK